MRRGHARGRGAVSQPGSTVAPTRVAPPVPAPRAAGLAAVVAFVRLGRPLFLVGGFVMYGLGVAIAAWHGHAVDARRYALGQLAVTAFQLMTHYANDYFDYDCDRANATPSRWSGGSRVLVRAELPRRVALIAAVALAALGVGIAAAVVAVAGPGAAMILVPMAALAWAYSAPPWRLCAAGAGELDTAIVVTGLVPLLGFYLQAPDLSGLASLALAIVPLALLQFAMLLALELADAAGDAATGKRTLVVLLGARRGARLYAATTLAAFAWLPLAAAFGLPAQVAALAAIPAPLAIWRAARITDARDPSGHARVAFFAVALLVSTAACMLAGFVLSGRWT
jgi:1,4-dihydroxy-2-naphthoate polyprenyltransferase